MVRRDSETGVITIPDWQLLAIVGVLIAVSGSIGTGVAYILWEHNVKIAVHDTLLATLSQQMKQSDAQADKADLKLTRIDEKIDRIFDEIRKK